MLTSQFVHVAAPVPILYFPATHKKHGPPLDPVAPILQAQELIEVCDVDACPEFNGQSSQATVAAIVVEYLPAVQSVHKPAPVAGLYFPATQAVHIPLRPV